MARHKKEVQPSFRPTRRMAYTPRHFSMPVPAPKKSIGKKITATTLSVTLLAGIAGAGVIYNLQSNITTEPLNLAAKQPEQHNELQEYEAVVQNEHENDAPMQILVIGTDTRKGTSKYGGESLSTGYGSADVMLLLHLSADNENATVVSFPRDLMVPLPSCENPQTGATSAAQPAGQLNSTLMYGPGCTVAAINSVTGLQIDHMMLADFKAVKELSKEIGGVEVCVTDEVHDEKSGLDLPAGVSTVEGEQALAFLRTRGSFANGSDLGRIRAQQGFLSSMARKLTAQETLTDLPKLYSIADTITKNLTVDEDLASIPSLINVADRLSTIDVSDLRFITVPNEPWVQDNNRVQLTAAPAEELFTALRYDTVESPKEKEKDESKVTVAQNKKEREQEVPVPTVGGGGDDDFDPSLSEYEKSIISLTLVNRSGADNRGTALQKSLIKDGWMNPVVAGADSTLPITQILYAYGMEEYALALAEGLGIAPAQVQLSDDATGITISVGEDFVKGKKIEQPEGLSGKLEGQTADQVTCQVVR